jgi:hypothetical protein
MASLCLNVMRATLPVRLKRFLRRAGRETDRQLNLAVLCHRGWCQPDSNDEGDQSYWPGA